MKVFNIMNVNTAQKKINSDDKLREKNKCK